MAFTDWPDGKKHSISYAQHKRNVAKKKRTSGSLNDRVKHDPKLLERALADPGLRSKLDDRYLSPEQRATRKRNSFLRAIGDPNTPLAGDDMVNAAHQLTNSEFDPLLADIGRQEGVIKTSGQTQQDYGKRYYADLDKIFGTTGAAQDTANAAAVAGANTRGAQTQTAIQGAAQGARDRIAADAAIRGGHSGEAPQQLETQTADQAALAATEAQRAAQEAERAGGAQAAFMRGLRGSTAQAGGEYQQQISGDTAKLLQSLSADRAKLNEDRKGAFTDTLLKLRQQEADNSFTRAGLGLDSAKLDAQAAQDAADRAAQDARDRRQDATTRRGQDVTKRGQDLSHKDRQDSIAARKKNGRGGSGDGRASTKDVGAAQDAYGAAAARARQLAKTIKDPNKLRQALVNGSPGVTPVTVSYKDKSGRTITQKVDPRTGKPVSGNGELKGVDALWASIAVDMLHDGHVSRRNADRLHARGLKVSDLGLTSFTEYRRRHAADVKRDQSRYGKH